MVVCDILRTVSFLVQRSNRFVCSGLISPYVILLTQCRGSENENNKEVPGLIVPLFYSLLPTGWSGEC